MNHKLPKISYLIFASRWLQAPLYLGLVFVLAIYVYEFMKELVHLVMSLNQATEIQIMLAVLDLIDVVMIANLLIMVIIGGYEIFVSRLYLSGHPDEPEWLDHVDAGTMKIKLALALIGISSIHLLKTFISPQELSNATVMWQVIIHLTFIVSAIAIAYTNSLVHRTRKSSALNN